MALYLQMDGVDDWLRTPTITFTECIIDMSATPTNDWRTYFDANGGISNSNVTRDDTGKDIFGTGINAVYKNGVAQTSGTTFIDSTRAIYRIVFASAGTDNVNIFSNQLGTNATTVKGKLYSVKFLNDANIVAHYDFTRGNANDQSGNKNHATLVGGTFVEPTAISYLLMDGVDDYIQLPTMTASRLEIDCLINATQNDTRDMLFDTRTGSNQLIDVGFTTLRFKINGGAEQTSHTAIPKDTRNVLDIRSSFSSVTTWTDNFTIFADNTPAKFLAGRIYSIKLYNDTTLVAHYDVTTGSLQDLSGNGNHATLYGGTFVYNPSTYLSFDGTDDYLQLPTMTMKKVVIDGYFPLPQADLKMLLDARSGVSIGYVYARTNGTLTSSGGIFTITNFIYNSRCVATFSNDNVSYLDGTNNFTDNVTLFSSGAGDFYIGHIYSVKCYNNAGTLLAHYDMSTGTVLDQSGNGNHAQLIGGNFINEGKPYVLLTDGIDDGILTPSFSYDEVIMEFSASPATNNLKYIGTSTSGYIQSFSRPTDSWDSSVFSNVYINDLAVTNSTDFVPYDKRVIMRATRVGNGAITTTLMKHNTSSGYTQGVLYNATFKLSGAVVCQYDFTKGHTLDISGNNRHATAVGNPRFIDTSRKYYLSLDGVDDSIAFGSFLYSKIVIDAQYSYEGSGLRYVFQSGTAFVRFSDSTTIFTGGVTYTMDSMTNRGITTIDITTPTNNIPRLFARQDGSNNFLKAKVYSVKFYNGSNLVAHYDFTRGYTLDFSGTGVANITLIGGATFVDDGASNLLIADSFSKSDSTSLGVAETGQVWTVTGTKGIISNQAYINTDFGGIGIDAGITEFNVQVKFSIIAEEPTLIFRRLGTTTYVGVTALSDRYVIKGFNLDEGFMTYDTYMTTPANGDIIRVEVKSNVAKVYINETLRMTWTIQVSKYPESTFVGLRALGTTNRFDDFRVESISTPVCSIVSTSKTRISDETGQNQSVITFKFDKDVTQWVAKLGGVDYQTGITVDSGKGLLLVSDLFNRANSTTSLGNANIGGAWTVGGAGSPIYGINNNQAYQVSGTSFDWQYAYMDKGKADLRVTATFTLISSFPNLVLRGSDFNNYIQLVTGAVGSPYILYKMDSGVNYTEIARGGTSANGDVVTVTLIGSSIIVTVNGTDIITTSSTFNQTSTRFGFSLQRVPANRMDDFKIEDISNIPTNTNIDATVDWNEGLSNGQNRINIYGQDADGRWTVYNS